VLSPLQEQVGRIVAALPEADGFALAGGAALVVARVVDRATRDLDFFGPSADDVDRLVPVVESALVAAELTVRRERCSHGFARLTVVGGDDVTELDLAADARIRPVGSGPLGPMLSLEELGADKLLALFDRAQPRDFVDVAALVDRFGLERLCETGEREGSRVLPVSPGRDARRLRPVRI
jgi:predicted nucleotidyltransferase component of viral defense system